MTDEQLIEYMDTAQERIEHDAAVEHESMVIAVQIGTIIAHDAKALRQWQARSRRNKGEAGLTGAALERAVMGLRARNPEYVVVA